jgi:predicted RNase H-like HicB family nuclease
VNYRIEFEQEEDGRWIADVPELPGVMAYGRSRQDAELKVLAIVLRLRNVGS